MLAHGLTPYHVIDYSLWPFGNHVSLEYDFGVSCITALRSYFDTKVTSYSLGTVEEDALYCIPEPFVSSYCVLLKKWTDTRDYESTGLVAYIARRPIVDDTRLAVFAETFNSTEVAMLASLVGYRGFGWLYNRLCTIAEKQVSNLIAGTTVDG